jgi:peptide/nickel transport system permease protein
MRGAALRFRVALVFLAAIHVAALFAGLLAPYDYAEQHRDYPYAAPMRIHFSGLHPYVTDPNDPSRIWPIHFLASGRLFGVDTPGVIFLFGSDGFGRDVLSRVLYGARISLFTGLLAAFLALALGTAMGTLAGYLGGWPDQVLMRTGELTIALPWLYLLLALRAFLPLHIGTLEAFLLLIVVIGSAGWVRPARLVRSVVLSGKERDFVSAARGMGASPIYLIRRHILPLTWATVITQATVLIPQFVLAEVTLSFLGLGVGEPVPSWGNMLAEGMQYHAVISHTWLLLPGFTTIPVLLSYLMLADLVLVPRSGEVRG